MKLFNFMEVLSAACLTWTVESEFEQTGGIMIASPVGQLKTSLLSCLENIPGVRGVSDLTARELSRMHDDIESKRIRALVFYEFPKLYERKSETASNILGHIRSLVDEGFTGIASEAGGMRSRAVVLAAMPLRFWRVHEAEWRDNGFARRMLLCRYRLADPRVIDESIITGNTIPLSHNHAIAPLRTVKMSVTEAESRVLARYLRDQPGSATPLITLKKIVSVLRWKAKQCHRADDSMEIIKDFAKSLSAHGDELYL